MFVRLALSLFLAAGLGIGTAAAQESRYQSWQGPEERLEAMIEELRSLVDEAERARAADPRFLSDLRGLAGRYSSPWARHILSDDFSDGNYTENPAWTVASGSFQVAGRALESTVQAQPQAAAQQPSGQLRGEDLAAALLQQLLTGNAQQQGGSGGSGGQASSQPVPAEIFVAREIPNAFSITAEMTLKAPAGAGGFEIAVYQGNDRKSGYRLVFTADRSARLFITTRKGSAIIESAPKRVAVLDGATQRIEWTRSREGAFSVRIDGTEVISTTDTRFRQAFHGLTMVNHGGTMSLRRIVVDGAS